MNIYAGIQTKAFLIVQRGEEIGEQIILDKQRTTIGRNTDNVIVLTDPRVSRYHAVIQLDPTNGQLSIIDLGSTNGVMVNDRQISRGLPYPLQPRNSIIIGQSVFKLQVRPEGYQPVRPPDRANDPNITQYLEMKRLFS
ncbi:MAG: FHA domain-containing protein [Chloroflexota bacterium]|nr:FHA domain-containing protein [Chloroflexota bacterium]